MRIVITGASGFVGRHLIKALNKKRIEVVPIGRADFKKGIHILSKLLDGADAVFNLCGENINQRWTKVAKQRFYQSRVENTRMLVNAMAGTDAPPKLMISTSAIGAFMAGEEHYTESDSANATDFLGVLAHDWEQEAKRAESIGVRTLIFRFGLVLGRDGGMLKSLLLPFRMGLGGTIGDGRQAMSWIHIEDLVSAYLWALQQNSLTGTYHLCAPNPVNNRKFSQILGQVLHRPAFLPMPVWVLRLLFGEGADVMASGQNVTSERLPTAGFQFRYSKLKGALESILLSQSTMSWTPSMHNQ